MIDVLIVDDHALFRQGLRLLLARSNEMRVVGDASNYAEAIELLRQHAPQVAIVDLSLPGRDGLDLIAYLRSAAPDVGVLVLSMHGEEEYAARALRAGAQGYLTKDSSGDQLTTAIVRIAAGSSYVCPKIAAGLAMRVARRVVDAPRHSALSGREYKVFEMLVQGKTITAIARELSLSAKTVSTHKMRLLRKMEMQSAGELVRYAVQNQIGML